jgi:hypothetical protein
MGCEAKLLEERIKEAARLIIVRVGELKGDKNVRSDVHGLKNGSGGNRGGGCQIGAIHGGGVGRDRRGVGVGVVEVEERIVIQVRHGDGEKWQRLRGQWTARESCGEQVINPS